MKKKIVVFNVVGLILMVLAVAAFMIGPWFFGLRGMKPFYTYGEVFGGIGNLFSALFTFQPVDAIKIVVLSVAGVFVILLLVQLIMLIAKKHGKAILAWFAFLLASAILVFMALWILTPGVANYYASDFADNKLGLFGIALAAFQGKILGYGNLRKILTLIFIIALVAFLVIGFILMFVGFILDLVYLGKLNNKKEEKLVDAPAEEEEEEVEVAEDEEVMAEEVPEEEEKDEDDGRYRPRPQEAPVMPAGITGPLLVQYINTYAPDAGRKNAVPVSEINDVINGEKPLNADDIRKIIKEELAAKEEAPAQPVIVSVPAPKKEEEPSLSADDVRKIFEEELRKAQPNEGDVVVEEEPAPSLTADEVLAIIAEALAEKPEEPVQQEEEKEEVDVREIIREELKSFYGEKDAAEEARRQAEEEEAARKQAEEEEAARQAAEEEAAKKAAEEEAARQAAEEEAQRQAAEEEAQRQAEEEAARKAAEEEAHRQAIEDARREAAEEARREAEEEAARRQAEADEEAAKREAEAEAARKEAEAARKEAEEARANALTADDIRKIIADALAADKANEKPAEPAPAGLTAEEVREIIRDELKDVVKEEAAPAEPAPVVVEEAKPAEPAPAPTVTVVVNAPAEKPAEPAVEEEEEVEKGPSPERIPFPTRLLGADEDVQEHYNVLKSEILSYGVKSRVSNTGDTFRLHKITYVKITVAGKGLKLYFALDPKDYKDSKIPVADAGHKGVYQDIPLVFKVKSDLSLRRAKMLIADVMAKFGNEKGPVEERDWSYALKDYGNLAEDDD